MVFETLFRTKDFHENEAGLDKSIYRFKSFDCELKSI